jgi:hypothetical protein
LSLRGAFHTGASALSEHRMTGGNQRFSKGR